MTILEDVPHIIYTDLDSLFDTRLTVLANIDIKYMGALKGNLWHCRDTELPSSVSKEDANKYYSNYLERDKHVLVQSPPTDIVDYLRTYNASIIACNAKTEYSYRSTILLNLWPYTLTDDEIELITNGLSAATLVGNGVEVINKDPATIDYDFIKDNKVNSLVCFNYRDMLDNICSGEKIKNNSLVDVSLFIPDLLYGSIPEGVNTKEEALQLTEEYMLPIINLKFIPVGYFCSRVSLKK